MQVRKFEAPTMQEALDAIKQELGPEAVILQTRNHRKGFGLLSKPSVEVTAAVANESLGKKKLLDQRLPEYSKEVVQPLQADQQKKIYDKYSEGVLDQASKAIQDKVQLSSNSRKNRARIVLNDPKPSSTGGAVKMEEEFPKVKVTARRYADISDEDQSEIEKVTITSKPDHKAARLNELLANRQAMGNANGVQGLKSEIENLKAEIDQLRSGASVQKDSDFKPDFLASPYMVEAYDLLSVNGVTKSDAVSLLKQVAFALSDRETYSREDVLDQLAFEIMENVSIIEMLDGIQPKKSGSESKGANVFAFVGPTGVGKTTTLAKVASEAKLSRKLRVGLINLDTYKVAAKDQLSSYAKILTVPFRSVETEDELKEALEDFQSLDLVLIDTTGRSQRDEESLKKMEKLLSSIDGIRTQLIVSSTTKDRELFDVTKRFNSVFHPEGLIVTKLDESMTYGSIYNLSQRMKLPLVYFTTGQRVPEDIEVASAERMVALLMDL